MLKDFFFFFLVLACWFLSVGSHMFMSTHLGLAGASQTKVVTGQAAGLVPAQFIVQQATGGGTAQTGTQGENKV